MSAPSLETTPIPGLLVVHIPVFADGRGWFKESWQREKMIAIGLPDFGPVQNNISFNAVRGATRGIHAEPWEKLVSIASGRVFGAWVDLRAGASFGSTYWIEIDPSIAVFVPRGVGNSYQSLADATAYSYLVNEHWRPGVDYPALDLGDPSAAIPWPIPLAEAEISEKDRRNPQLSDIVPMTSRRTLILGCRGQLGRALAAEFPEADRVDVGDLDITDPVAVDGWPWWQYDVVLNAAAYTAVDAAETAEGRMACWSTNALAPALLARVAAEHRFVLVHYSSDYVFDGRVEEHAEDEPVSPLSVYGQSKAAGDLAVAGHGRHYILRTSWVIGEGKNFVRTMAELARRGDCPAVVDDQWGRLTFADELARATRHLLDASHPYGTYNVTNAGPVMSWWDLAREIFVLHDREPLDVRAVTTAEYSEGKPHAERPRHSALALKKIRATAFVPEAVTSSLRRYLTEERSRPSA